jgi:hypothetical protein
MQMIIASIIKLYNCRMKLCKLLVCRGRQAVFQKYVKQTSSTQFGSSLVYVEKYNMVFHANTNFRVEVNSIVLEHILTRRETLLYTKPTECVCIYRAVDNQDFIDNFYLTLTFSNPTRTAKGF